MVIPVASGSVGPAATSQAMCLPTSSKTSLSLATFNFPLRPNLGSCGQEIKLRVNHFPITVTNGSFHHYEVTIYPETCPGRVNKEIFKAMMHQYPKMFKDQNPVYDGVTNMYIKGKLRQPRGLSFKVRLPNRDTGRISVFDVNIRWKAKIDLSILNETLQDRITMMPADITQALDAILQHLPSMMQTLIGRSFFSPPSYDNYHPLSGGLEVWFGYHQRVLPSMWTMTVNINASSAAFYKDQSVISFMCDVLKIPVKELRKTLTDSQRLIFSKEIKDLKIRTTHTGDVKRKYRVQYVTTQSAHDLWFTLQLPNGKKVNCSVAKYFAKKYGIKLRYPHLSCLQVSQEPKLTYLPLEVCSIVGGQHYVKKLKDVKTLIKATSMNATNREHDIIRLVKDRHFNEDPYVQEFGLAVSETMMEIRGRILPPPALQYGGTQNVKDQTIPHQGIWDMRGKQFYTGAVIKTWVVVCFAPEGICGIDTLKNFVQRLRNVSIDANMRIVRAPQFYKYATGVYEIESLFRSFKNDIVGLQLVLAVLHGKSAVYPEVKRVGDTVLGMVTQCIQFKSMKSDSLHLLSNVCQKINVKLGGINNVLVQHVRPQIFNEPVMILGADVSHSHNGDSRSYTVSAVVASMDAHPSRYATTVRVQKYKDDTKCHEIIQDLTSMVKELLVQFYKRTSFKPIRIVFYRDGVPEGHFHHVLDYELSAIRNACISLECDYKPGITIVVIQKHHHTRFFCESKDDKVGRSANIPAGTTVDNFITHPTEFDFYLCSHAGIQGTSRPTYYQVLWDDNKFPADELQSLTYQLCYTYARCTRSVCIPAPAYYAHLVATRARYHLLDHNKANSENSHQSSNSESRTLDALIQAITLHRNVKKEMYFA